MTGYLCRTGSVHLFWMSSCCSVALRRYIFQIAEAEGLEFGRESSLISWEERYHVLLVPVVFLSSGLLDA
jgi:hypothetical protein